MQRGFVSILFGAVLLALLHAQVVLSTQSPLLFSHESEALLTQRTLLENGSENTIQNALHEGLKTKQEGEIIRNGINEQLLDYWKETQEHTTLPLQTQFGFFSLQTTQYLNVLDQNSIPLSLSELNARSHVFILPISGEVWYGEYAYTGGFLGQEVAGAKITGIEGETLFAFPPGMRICSTSVLETIPCEGN